MLPLLRSKWLNLRYTLWFVPGVVTAAYVVLAVGLVQLDQSFRFRSQWVFDGTGDAARTVLATIAGSLITVAGLTFSVTMIVLQLTSSQFSPRVLRNFFGDWITQLTIGSFVGIFAYCLVALRSGGSLSPGGAFVPRLAVTVASGLGVAAVAMLIVFIHHIAQLIQASELTARIAHETLKAVGELYPEEYGEGAGPEAGELVEAWQAEGPAGVVPPARPGFVQSAAIDALVHELGPERPRLHVRVVPGDFVGVETPLARVWPAAAAEEVRRQVHRAIAVAGERDFAQDAHFGVRQLTDIALRAISPSVNDPTTAATCIGYLRSILVRLAERDFPPEVRRFDDGGEPVVVRRRSFAEYVESFAEIGRYAGDARIAGDVLRALAAVVEAATRAEAPDRAGTAAEIADAVAEQAIDEAKTERDRDALRALHERVEQARAG